MKRIIEVLVRSRFISTGMLLVFASLSIVLITGLSKPSIAASPNGVDNLRGRWEGVIENLFDSDRSFTLLLNDFEVDPEDSTIALASGCLSVGDTGKMTPLSAKAISLGNGEFEVTILGTAASTNGALIIRLTGTAETLGSGVTDDFIGGSWKTAYEDGSWSAYHHDRRRPKCPPVQLGDGLYFDADVYTAVGLNNDGTFNATTILESFTNIVSSAVKVEIPDGSILLIPLFTDIFTPQIDFINNFRFIGDPNGLPVVDGTYTFTLMDIHGLPIPGTTKSDIWLGNKVDAPREVTASVDNNDGILVKWDPVDPAPGFDPQGPSPIGFYQIEFYSEGGESVYGAVCSQTSHLIPMSSSDFTSGVPDGTNFGKSLEELDNGTYYFNVVAFVMAPPLSDAHRIEYQVRAWEEIITFVKTDNVFTIQ
ncbi:MAG: hypothetical protein U9Q58_03560 [Pseudomonadota bacterium]|nr:hypothetical protein [Pseudomonadota bacterium]